MTDHSQIATETPSSAAGPAERQYDMRRLSYAGTFKNPWKAGTIRALEWLTAKLRLLSLIRSFETVSYTHLRAHETVLDLVCRLLLEKKKKKKK